MNFNTITNIPNLIEITNQQGNINSETNDFLETIDRLFSTSRHLERGTTHWTGEIKFLLWNATGLMPNLDRIIKRMEGEDILLGFITETWLNPKYSIPSVCRETSSICSILPIGYDRGKNGVSIIINPKMIKHPALKDFETLSKDTLNGTYIHIKIGNVQILCIYYPPSCPTDLDTWLEEIFMKCNITGTDDIILLGDFNARLPEWGDHQGNSNGHKLKSFIESINVKRIDTGNNPTFIKSMSRPQDGWSIIDHVFSNCETTETAVTSPITPAAGHRPITGIFKITADTRNEPPRYKRLFLEKLRDETTRETLKNKLEQTSATLLLRLRLL